MTGETALASGHGGAPVPAGLAVAVRPAEAAPAAAGQPAKAVLPANAVLPATVVPADGTAGAGGPVAPGGDGGAPRPPWCRRPGFGWTAVALTAAVGIIAVIAFTLTRSPGPSGSAPGAASANGPVTPAVRSASPVPSATASAGTAQRGGTATPQTSPGGQSSRAPRQKPGQTGTARPTPSRTGAATPSATSPATPASPPVSGTPSPSVSPTATPSPTGPADTTWQCGPAAAATLASGKSTGQTLRACIRVHNGKLALHGILGATVKAWHEQIVLLLEDAAGNVSGTYYSPVCTTATCNFTMTTTPARGEWTVLPEWARYGGNLMSAGGAPGYVDF